MIGVRNMGDGGNRPPPPRPRGICADRSSWRRRFPQLQLWFKFTKRFFYWRCISSFLQQLFWRKQSHLHSQADGKGSQKHAVLLLVVSSILSPKGRGKIIHPYTKGSGLPSNSVLKQHNFNHLLGTFWPYCISELFWAPTQKCFQSF